MAHTLAFVPRRGFTVRPVADGWQLRNPRHYGDVVLQEWPKSARREAFIHAYRLNGGSLEELSALLSS